MPVLALEPRRCAAGGRSWPPADRVPRLEHWERPLGVQLTPRRRGPVLTGWRRRRRWRALHEGEPEGEKTPLAHPGRCVLLLVGWSTPLTIALGLLGGLQGLGSFETSVPLGQVAGLPAAVLPDHGALFVGMAAPVRLGGQTPAPGANG